MIDLQEEALRQRINQIKASTIIKLFLKPDYCDEPFKVIGILEKFLADRLTVHIPWNMVNPANFRLSDIAEVFELESFKELLTSKNTIAREWARKKYDH